MAAFMRRRVCPLIQLLAVGVAQCKQAPQCVLQPTGACAPDRVALVLPRWPSIPSRPGSAEHAALMLVSYMTLAI